MKHVDIFIYSFGSAIFTATAGYDTDWGPAVLISITAAAFNTASILACRWVVQVYMRHQAWKRLRKFTVSANCPVCDTMTLEVTSLSSIECTSCETSFKVEPTS